MQMSFYTETNLLLAYRWLCRRRSHYHYNNDVWHLRFHWAREKARLPEELRDETFRFDWVAPAPTRWKLHRAMATVNPTLAALRLAAKTLHHHQEKIS